MRTLNVRSGFRTRALRRGHRSRDRIQRRVGLGAIGTAGLRHVGPPTAALAAERLGGHAHQVDRIEARDQIRRDADHDTGLAIVGVTEDGKAGVVVGVTPDLIARFNAVNLVRVASEALGGKGGGGRPDMAQAGGPDGAKANAALDAIAAAMAAA